MPTPSIFFLVLAIITYRMDHLQQGQHVTRMVGVYQGKPIFIQNPFIKSDKRFCVSRIEVNDEPLQLNTKLSAIRLDLSGLDLYTPVTIEVFHEDSVCSPEILNPQAIEFHSTFSFKKIFMNDSVLTWETVGDQGKGLYVVEKYKNGLWHEVDTLASKGQFEGASYFYYPDVDEGPNKYRVKYLYPDKERYLYTMEVDFHFYPDPVTFRPKKVKDYLYLSRVATYEIYDAGSNLVLSGNGIQIDVSNLPSGDYVIYFEKSDPGIFSK